MFEKLKTPKHISWDDSPEGLIQRHRIIADVYEKVNQLVDAVNEIMTWRFETDEDSDCDPKHREQPIDQYTEQPNCPEQMGYIKLDSDSLAKFLKIHPEYNNNGVIEIPKKEPADAYAEQRRWIGKLCRFWDIDGEGYLYEILIDIEDDGSDYPYKIVETDSKNWTLSYKHCEPVSEDLIYKGE